jgi:nitrate/TMAO reductase-like tetraheme cytochrome c subunit
MVEELKAYLHRPLFLLSAAGVLLIGGIISYKIMDATVMAKPAFCATCHNMQYEYDTYTQEGLLAHKHAEADVTCHDCHEPSIGQQMNEGWLFVTGQYDNPTKRYGFTNEQCLSCHKWEEVVEATAHFGNHAPHYGEHEKGNTPPQCMDCHSVHHKQSTQKCNTCHSMKWEGLDESWIVQAK